MFNPKFYETCNENQRYEVKYFIENFKPFLNWEKGDDNYTLDIGSGDGKTTKEVVLPFVGGHVIGIDFESMTQHAQRLHQSNQVNFVAFDISDHNIPIEFIDKFDHAVSFWCLMYVGDQSQAYKNINKMLKLNGDFFFVFVHRSGLFPIYQVLAKREKWEQYLKKADSYSIVYNTKNLEETFPDFLSSHGFETKFCYREDKQFCFDVNSFKDFIKSVCPFTCEIPENLLPAYIDDFFDEAVICPEYNFVVQRQTDGEIKRIRYKFDAIVVHAQKISHIQ